MTPHRLTNPPPRLAEKALAVGVGRSKIPMSFLASKWPAMASTPPVLRPGADDAEGRGHPQSAPRPTQLPPQHQHQPDGRRPPSSAPMRAGGHAGSRGGGTNGGANASDSTVGAVHSTPLPSGASAGTPCHTLSSNGTRGSGMSSRSKEERRTLRKLRKHLSQQLEQQSALLDQVSIAPSQSAACRALAADLEKVHGGTLKRAFL